MARARPTKRDNTVQSIRKIAEEVFDKLQQTTPGATGVPRTTGGFGGGGGGLLSNPPSAILIPAYMLGVAGTPTVTTLAQRNSLRANGAIHMYDDAADNSITFRLNQINDPMHWMGL